jgi:transposase
MFVGIDRASRAHELCVVDDRGTVVTRFGFAHSERGLRDAVGANTRSGEGRGLRWRL